MKVNLKSWILTVFISASLLNSSCDTISAQQLSAENIVIPQAQNSPVKNSQVQDSKILHIVNRLSFGAAPGDVVKVKEIGIDKYIQQQLTPESIPEPQSLKNQLSQLQTLKLTPAQLYSQYSVGTLTKPTPEIRKKRRKKQRLIRKQAVRARLLRATESPRQLQEVMVDFWYNHFNVYQNKGLTRLWMSAYEEQAIRPHVFGKFRDLLGATARHPAMLFYLDNWQNTAPNNRPKGRFKGLNENYARELMELHTLGVDGGYTQEDVIVLAKIFTGWGFHNKPRKVKNGYDFYFNSKRHDFTDKVFLGKQIKGSGIAEGEQALDILAKHPATARHISYKLAQYFVADEPPKTLIEKLSKSYLATDGDIQAVLKTLFQSSEFWDRKYYNAKFKTPYQYVISSIRATDTPINDFPRINSILHRMGMPLYGNPTPDGYKNTQQAWLNPNGINWRLSFANTIGRGGLKNRNRNNKKNNNNKNTPRRPNKSIDSAQLANTLGNNFSAKTQEVLNESPPKQRAVIILGSPEFMYR
ncbi:hypothetical protein Riv7116_3104 [Rivularia sp. PCC 7116]|uniref:DUF1800 domain-containing protein n=1 Tax=Rivularia sp. PCC 7116 TaxID=373994 RepID=UPI00029EDB51|nr:DUF1800 domain-containing protein [Rivularia sp. PCC 7116]AFY55579.1 hypothetical protein Riv7116_3104 [Rivularia sp. PCC 7116]